ncbi:MAG: dinitrogenase iron-molybdenum cofactor [Firmicutes bacterium HGW-Firmicutes-14]|jgi:predicted Fe-Mo cluster-binding NifX family protein|nr:MAG: dinitrogenase iron-molybdenum cofactor [Firmicutes bacterium HGW-Firmicutes-14]
MKIAIAMEGNTVSEHFGHCENFYVADIENKEVKNPQVIANPGHVPGFLPKFLAEKKVECIITGGIGAKAIELFNEMGIEVITGARGTAEEVVPGYIRGELVSTGSVCREHMHAGECGGH